MLHLLGVVLDDHGYHPHRCLRRPLFVFLVAIAIMTRSAIKECCSGNRNSKQSSHNKRELVPVMVPVHQLGQQAPVVASTAATT